MPNALHLVPSPLRTERTADVCRRLSTLNIEVAVCQEAWSAQERRTLSQCGLPFVADPNSPSRAIDSGLMILSRHPIRRSIFSAFSRTGILLPEVHPESLARKGFLATWIGREGQRPLLVVTTHLAANYA